jgi:hypothetical protein
LSYFLFQVFCILIWKMNVQIDAEIDITEMA